MCNELKRRPGWIVCRNMKEIPVPSIDVLPQWAERGRLLPDDYLVNPIIESCVQVKDVPDLNAIFRAARLRRLRSIVKKVLFWQA